MHSLSKETHGGHWPTRNRIQGVHSSTIILQCFTLFHPRALSGVRLLCHFLTFKTKSHVSLSLSEMVWRTLESLTSFADKDNFRVK